MPPRMTNSEFNTTLNGIAVDSMILTVIILIGLVIFGTVHEHGDLNSGGMYGLYILPAIPVILVSLGLIAASKFYLKPRMTWLHCITPLVLLVCGLWLNQTDIIILLTILSLIIVYSLIKTTIKSTAT
jgi:hypothetical protein